MSKLFWGRFIHDLLLSLMYVSPIACIFIAFLKALLLAINVHTSDEEKKQVILMVVYLIVAGLMFQAISTARSLIGLP